jgi:hypothetical protein
MSAAHETGDGVHSFGEFGVACGIVAFGGGLGYAVAEVFVDECDGDALQAAVVEDSWVSTSMQYSSVSIMRCRPRTWPSMRRRRIT